MANKIPAKQITQWSYSRFRDYEKCPAYAKFKYIDRLPEPASDAMDRGIALHKMAEDFLNGKLRRVPKEIALIGDDLKLAKKNNAVAEAQWSFTTEWSMTDWFAKNTWLRVKVDYHFVDQKQNVLFIDDVKSGKPKGEYEEQCSIYGTAGLIMYPYVDKVIARLKYTDYPVTEKMEYDRGDLVRLKKDWVKKTKPMLSDKKFPAKPNNACRWCAFSNAKGGPCKF